MNKSWKLIPKIVSGEKSIESRWYKTRRAPWGTVKAGDIIYFKNSGEMVTAKAEVEKVIQVQIKDISDIQKILKSYGKHICLINNKPETWGKVPKYCILIFLKNAKYVTPFTIGKSGFGSATAWMSLRGIEDISGVAGQN